MKPVQFLSNSKKINNIVKGLSLTKSLFVSSLLTGEEHTGKRSLIKTLFPNSTYVDASNQEELLLALENNNELIIYNFEKIVNLELLPLENRRIVAIANNLKSTSKFAKNFAFIYKMPSLSERDDLEEFISFFQTKIQKELMIKEASPLKIEELDLSQNIKSLKASITKQLLLKSLEKEDIKEILHNYLYEKLEGNNGYREHLSLYEEPLLLAGLKKYKSQLKLSAVLGLNRNTLRKKIQEHGLD